MSKAPAYQRYANDSLAEVAFLSMEDRGILITLRDYYWVKNGLPNDLELLARLCLMNADAFALRWHSTISGFFIADDKQLHLPDLDAQKQFQEEKREKAQTSAHKRWKDKNAMPSDMRTHKPSDMPSECTSTSTSTSIKRTTNVVPKKTAHRIPEDFALDTEKRSWADKNVPGVAIEHETANFKDHYKTASGRNAVGLDWVAKWRTWMRNAYTKFGTVTPIIKPTLSTDEAEFRQSYLDAEAAFRKSIPLPKSSNGVKANV